MGIIVVVSSVILLLSIIFFLKWKQRQRFSHRVKRDVSDFLHITGKGNIKIIYTKSSAANASVSNAERQLSTFWSESFYNRRIYNVNAYLQSARWQRKRRIVLKRDKWSCVHCGSFATHVLPKHTTQRPAKKRIGALESVCEPCFKDLQL